MEEITVIFGKGKSPFSWLIRAFTWSRWSHVGIVDGIKVIEARADGGVVETYLDDFKFRYDDYRLATIKVDSRSNTIVRARRELGKSYDFTAIFGILFRSGWDSADKWFCSELIAHSTKLFRNARVSRITPEMVWAISKDKK